MLDKASNKNVLKISVYKSGLLERSWGKSRFLISFSKNRKNKNAQSGHYLPKFSVFSLFWTFAPASFYTTYRYNSIFIAQYIVF
ncbi:hypothetical protein AALA52_05125 [Lactococcus ileimucosae]|uniref:Uncharacterized protein n=1 Tax=Lactococcus ileimucosae TaxID=2941329 RepID=A0ABV4D3N9_9LACT